MSTRPNQESRGPSGSGTEIRPRWTGATEAAGEAVSLVDLAIRRTRANPFVTEEVKESICGPLEEAKRQVLLGGRDADHVERVGGNQAIRLGMARSVASEVPEH